MRELTALRIYVFAPFLTFRWCSKFVEHLQPDSSSSGGFPFGKFNLHRLATSRFRHFWVVLLEVERYIS